MNRPIEHDELPSPDSVALRLLSLKAMPRLARRSYQYFTEKEIPKDFPPQWTPWRITGVAAARIQYLLRFVQDRQIRELCQLLLTEDQRLYAVNQDWARALSTFLRMEAPVNESSLKKLERRVDSYRRKQGPGWATRTEFAPLVVQSQQAASTMEEIWIKLEAKLKQVYSEGVVNVDIGDQRAKDLIDKSMSQSDPQRAISLLQKALQYGTTGVQAGKAYHWLGNWYAQLGDKARAIDNYTLSLQAWSEPNAMVLFSRGELYFQLGQWKDARSDFQRALASKWLRSPEREQAMSYLSKLKNL